MITKEKDKLDWGNIKKSLELTLNYLDNESDSSKIVCNGKRKLKIKENNPILYYCPKCHGKGKLDWVENIVGYKRAS